MADWVAREVRALLRAVEERFGGVLAFAARARRARAPKTSGHGGQKAGPWRSCDDPR